jgi:hypothetical protein
VGAFCSGHWTNQLYRFKDFAAEEIRGRFGGINFPLIHDWTYRGTECADEDKPFVSAQPAVVYDHGTSRRDEAVTTIRGDEDAIGAIKIDPVAGCPVITAGVVVYDRAKIREIALPNLFGAAHANLVEEIKRNVAKAALRGIKSPAP